MRGYFGLGQLSATDKTDILDQHKSVYNGYQTMQPQVSNRQPLYVYDDAGDKDGFVVNNRGEIKKYTNMGINEGVNDKNVCESCGGETNEGKVCEECSGGMGDRSGMKRNQIGLDEDYEDDDCELEENEWGAYDFESNGPNSGYNVYEEQMCESCGGETNEGKVCEECGGTGKTNIQELGGMDDGHPRFGNKKFPNKMSPEEIDDLLRGDEEDYNDEEDYKDRSMHNPYYNELEDNTINSYEPMQSAFDDNDEDDDEDDDEDNYNDDDDDDYDEDDDMDDGSETVPSFNPSGEYLSMVEPNGDMVIDDDLKESFFIQKNKITEMFNRLNKYN